MEFNQPFIVFSKGTPTTRKTQSGKLQVSQKILLRDPLAAENEGNHAVLFFDNSIPHLEKIECGDLVNLHFKIHAGISTTGIHHTNLVPTKIFKITN